MSVFDKLWVEKYRPRKLEDVVLPKKVRKQFEKFRGEKHIPHLLLVSPPGRGKTTLAKIVATELIESEYIYINASDDNGIDTVRGQIRQFAETASIFDQPKIIILDECDRMSKEAQDGLRNVFETFADNVRFILTANKGSAIQDAILSRCTVISDFTLPFDACYTRAKQILENEGVDYEDKVVKAILRKTLPDFRRAIQSFQFNFTDGKLELVDEVEEDFQKIVKLLWAGIKSDKYSVEQLREVIINKENEFPSYEILTQALHAHIYKTESSEDGVSIQRKATLEIATFLENVNTVMDVELSFYALIIKLRRIALGSI